MEEDPLRFSPRTPKLLSASGDVPVGGVTVVIHQYGRTLGRGRGKPGEPVRESVAEGADVPNE